MHKATGLIAASLLAGVACIFAAVPTALAQDDGYGYRFQPDGDSGLSGFAGLRGSLAFTSDTTATIPTATPTRLHSSYNTGGGGSFYFGTRLPLGLRLELEALYRYLPYNTVTLNGTGSVAHGQTQMGAPMVNLLWDLPVPDFPLRPFIGGGVGGAYVASRLKNEADTTTYLKSDGWHFAYELMGGAEFPLSQSSRFTAMYRWMQVNGVTGACGISGTPTMDCKASLNTQSIDLGLEMDM